MSCSIIYYENKVRNQGHDLGKTQKCGGALFIYFQDKVQAKNVNMWKASLVFRDTLSNISGTLWD
jgi:hypothetical protein